MLKKFFYLILFSFIFISALPFVKKPSSVITPIYQDFKDDSPLQKFYSTSLDVKYTKPSKVEFDYSPDLNKNAPKIQAKSAIAIDMTNKKVYFAKNEKEKLPVASLAKVMTALLAVEHSTLDAEFEVSQKAQDIGENSMGVTKGERYKLKELLYGLILNSGNDSAVTIAENLAGSEEEFVKWMNLRASLLGAKDTLFADSSGLNKDDKPFYSTALDMARIAYYSQTNHPNLKEIYSTIDITIPATSSHKQLYLSNQTNLLRTYPGVKGMKTGYTEESGLCLITYAQNKGKEVLIVILNSTDRRGDAILLLDYTFSKLGVSVEHNLLEN